nr:hypothetical protein [Micromonospora sp. DSM 115978]
MRTRRLGLIGVGLLAVAGCGDSNRQEPSDVARVPPVVQVPAASAGGACRALDYPTIEEVTGVRFDVSAASQHSSTNTCQLRSETAAHPDLVLSVTKTSADVETFKEEMTPEGGRSVGGLGKAAYRLTRSAGDGHGAGVEICWLTGDGRMLSLRYTFPVDGDREAADAFASKVVALAKRLDVRSL